MSTGRIARSTSTISLATAASRILGFVRDVLIAQLFGIGMQAQAFVVAFRLPNLLRDLVGEGAITSAIVPVLSAYRSTKSPQEFWRLAHALCMRMSVVVGIFGGVGVVLAPWLVRLIAPGFASDPEKYALTVTLTRILFPFIALVGLWAFFMGLLNSLRHFAMPALGPATLNLAMIAGCLWVAPHVTPAVLALAWGVMVGGLVQLLMQLPVAWRLGFRWRLIWSHPGSHEVMRLMTPRLVGSAVHQVSVFFNTILASLAVVAGEGAVAALYFANRLVQLPLALFGVASAQASLPTLAEQAATHELAAFRSTVVSVLRMVAFVTLPAAVGLIVLAHPIVGVCFQRGAFDEQSTRMTAQTLSYFSVGLLAYAASKVLSHAFYALQDTRTPVKLAVEALVVNVVLAVAFLGPLRVGGLALATALASHLNAWRLLRALEQRLGASLLPSLLTPLARISLASLVMGIGCWVVWKGATQAITPLVGLPLVIASGILLYGTSCAAIRVAELFTVLRWLARSLGIQPSSSA
jgi:putative peptidoglycan lipid II flippase